MTGYGECGSASHFFYRTLCHLAEKYEITIFSTVSAEALSQQLRKYYKGPVKVIQGARLGKLPSWRDYQRQIGEAEMEKAYDVAILVGAKGYSLTPKADKMREEIEKNDQWKCNWPPDLLPARKLFLFDYLDIPKKHYIIDPILEADRIFKGDVERIYFYNDPSIIPEATYEPFAEKGCETANDKKEYDFIFGCTCAIDPTGIRRLATKRIPQMDLGRTRLFPETNAVPHHEYIHYLRKSRFTLLLPSNDPNHFSSFRFWEAENLGCEVLIHESVQLEKGLQHHPEMLKKAKGNLISSLEELPERVGKKSKTK